MPVSGNVNLSVSVGQTATRDLGSASDSAQLNHLLSLVSGGSGAGAVDRVWSDQRTLAASANEDLDLAGSALLDAFGVAAVFAKVKLLVVQALPANVNNVVVGAAATNPWIGALNSTGTVSLRPGETLALICGPADANGHGVVAATGDLLRIANGGSGTSVDYKILVAGTVA